MSSSPRVSIGLPIYNGERYLRETLENWQQQDFEDYELIVSDNASTDASPDILAEFAARDPRVRVIRQDATLPAFDNYNCLVPEARGEYFAWTADDDLRDPSFLSKLVAVLDERPEVVLAHPQVQVFRGDDPSDLKPKVYFRRPCGTEDSKIARVCSVLRRSKTWGNVYGLIRREVLARTHLFHQPMGLVGDVGLMLELALHGKFALVPEVLFYLRYHDQALHRTQDDPMYDGGRGRRIDADTLRWVDELPLDPVERSLFLSELETWCRKAQKPRPWHLRLHPLRATWVRGRRTWVDLRRVLRGR